MVPLARRNLFSEKARFAMSIAGVAFAVLLILIVVSLYRGWSNVGRFYEQLPGDVWVAQPGTSDPFHSTSFLPLADAQRLATVKGVRTVIPVYARHIAFGERGHELDVFAMALAVQRPGVSARQQPDLLLQGEPGDQARLVAADTCWDDGHGRSPWVR